MRRLVMTVVVAIAATACGGPSPTGPTAVVPQNFQGRWTGDYVIASCTASGEFQFVFCDTFSTGSTWPMVVTLTQAGTQVTGTIDLGDASGPVNGFVSTTNHLILNGALTVITSGAVVTVSLSGWDTTSNGTTMSGGWASSWTASSLTGSGRLSHSIRVLAKTA